MFYTYVLQSETTGKLYIGQTSNLDGRIKRHNAGYCFSTKNHGPWKLIFFKQFVSRTESMAYERKLKSVKNRSYLLKKIIKEEELPDR